MIGLIVREKRHFIHKKGIRGEGVLKSGYVERGGGVLHVDKKMVINFNISLDKVDNPRGGGSGKLDMIFCCCNIRTLFDAFLASLDTC